MKGIHASLMALGALAAVTVPAAAQEDAATATIVADQVRDQGFECSEPVTADKDEASSKPDVPVYLLSCGNGSYRVEVIPDMAAKITALP